MAITKTTIEEPQAIPATSVTTMDLEAQAKSVLTANDRGIYTVPGEGLYPHQWLWDSCFIAIGMRHYDIERSKTEILSLLRGQWHNGMLPHIIISEGAQYRPDRNAWRSWLCPFAPDDVVTSGLTQPPMLAEAIIRIGEKLSSSERHSWYRMVYPALLKYHQWLYDERDPHSEGLALQIHPWETGLDNTPPWMAELREHLLPWWIRVIERAHLQGVYSLFRRDTQFVPASERSSNIETLANYDAQRRLRRKAYDIDRILDHSLFAIEDLTFNSIFIRANELLTHIAKSIREPLPPELVTRMEQTIKTFGQLWDQYTEQYYSRDFVTHKLLKQSSIAALLPLYAGCVSAERAKSVVRLLESRQLFGPAYPVPSTPINSPWFKPKTYWQGPTWVNTNWLIIDGLERYGFKDHAAILRETTLELVQNAGFYEYFDPLSGEPAGTNNFSWTAALTIDLLHDKS